jgi:hypothetical protein
MNVSDIGKRTAAWFVAGLILAALCGHGGVIVSAPNELLKLDDKEFLQNVLFFSTHANEKTTSADFWRVMDRLQQLPLQSGDEISHGVQMGYLAQAICRYGARKDFERLLALADKLPAEGWSRRHIWACCSPLPAGIRSRRCARTAGRLKLSGLTSSHPSRLRFRAGRMNWSTPSYCAGASRN